MGHIISSLNNNNNEELYNDLSKLQAKLDNGNIQNDALNKLNNELENQILTLKNTNDLELTKILKDNKIQKEELLSKCESEKMKNEELLSKYESEKMKNEELLSKYESEKMNVEELLTKYESERMKNKDLFNKYEFKRKEKDELESKYELEKKEKEELESKYELEKKDNNLSKLNLLKEFKIEKDNILNTHVKEIEILKNKIIIYEKQEIKLNEINKNQKTDIDEKLNGIVNMISYYKENSSEIINFILHKNNNIIPDYFEKEIITNTYNSLINMIYDNLIKIK